MAEGKILKATAGFYYVDTGGAIIQCRGRGLFRKEGQTPLVGDDVVIEISPEDGSGTVVKLLPRKNSLVRPPLANLDRMVLVISVADPAPNLLVADTYLAVLAHRDIPAHIALTKTDLADGAELLRLYRGAGYPVYPVGSNSAMSDLEPLTQVLSRGISAFCGNSGVGKSTLLNRIDPKLALPTGDTSKKLGRGKHTTRHVELIALAGGGLVADTPGFSSLDMLRMGHIPPEEMALCFPEFAPFLEERCRFDDCAHLREPGCRVLEAVEQGKIDRRRHENYGKLYDQAKSVDTWELEAKK